MRLPLALVLLLAAALAAGCGSSSKKSKTTTTTTAARPAADDSSVPKGCRSVPKVEPKPDGKLDKPPLTGPPPQRASIVTNCGTIRIVFEKAQPKTATSFAYLAKRRFFDGTTFWRVQRQPDGSNFVIQGGDPTNGGTGGPGYSVTERPPTNAQYTRGVVAMAKTEIEKPGTSGSQFFVVTAADAGLPADYAILGHVIGGQAAVQRIAAADADPQTGRATQTAVIQSVKIER